MKSSALVAGRGADAIVLTLRGVLVHELVHVSEELAHGIDARVRKLGRVEEFAAFRAVWEGHAESVTARVTGKHPEMAGHVSLSDRLAERQLSLESLIAHGVIEASAYVVGRRFIDSIEREGGADLVRRALSFPPRRMEPILTPLWFVHPELVPERLVDLAELADLLAQTWSPKEFECVHFGVFGEETGMGFVSMRDGVADDMRSATRDSRFVLVTGVEERHREGGFAWLHEFASSAAARIYVERKSARAGKRAPDDARSPVGTVAPLEDVYAADFAGAYRLLSSPAAPPGLRAFDGFFSGGTIAMWIAGSCDEARKDALLAAIERCFAAAREMAAAAAARRAAERR